MTNKQSLFFIRHSKLLLPYKDHSEIPLEVLADLASEKLNPPIDETYTQILIKEINRIIPLGEITEIYTSPSRRCQETSLLISNFIYQYFQKNTKVTILEDLREIKFDLKKIMRDNENLSIDIINNSVFSAMTIGQNCELFSDSYKRVEQIFKKIIPKNGKILLVTHDFLMRVIELYIKKQGLANSLNYENLKNTKRNLYLHGFATNDNLSDFFPF